MTPSSRRIGLAAFTLLVLAPLATRADGPPVMQALTSASGPVQAYQCLYEGVSNDAVRYRWYDASGAKIFDNVAAVPANLDSDERGELGPPNGFGEPNGKTSRIVCSIAQAEFSDGSTWVAGTKYHGKLLPAAFTEDSSASQ